MEYMPCSLTQILETCVLTPHQIALYMYAEPSMAKSVNGAVNGR